MHMTDRVAAVLAFLEQSAAHERATAAFLTEAGAADARGAARAYGAAAEAVRRLLLDTPAVAPQPHRAAAALHEPPRACPVALPVDLPPGVPQIEPPK
jgi:hypothetical protein